MTNEKRRGRPRRVETEAATARIWAYLTPSEREALREVAAENEVSIGQVLRDAVNEYVAEYSERRIFREFPTRVNLRVRAS